MPTRHCSGRLGGRHRPADAAGRAARYRGDRPALRAFGACRVPRPRTGAGILVPLYRRRRGEPDRPSAHRAGARRAARPAALRLRAPAPITNSATSRPTAIWRPKTPTSCCFSATTSTNIQQIRRKDARAQRRVEANDLRTYRNRYAQYRTDPDLRALHPNVPASRSGTTTRSRTITPISGRRISTTRSSSWSAAPPPIRHSGSTCRCRCGRGRAGRT